MATPNGVAAPRHAPARSDHDVMVDGVAVVDDGHADEEPLDDRRLAQSPSRPLAGPEPGAGDEPADTVVRVVLVDDHALVREGLRSVLSSFADVAIVAEADHADAARKQVAVHDPDVVLLDLQLRDADGLDVVRDLVRQGARAAVVVLTVYDEPERVRGALRAGARGYLLKSVRPVDLAEGIRRAAAGEWVIGREFVGMLVESFTGAVPMGRPEITAREREVLALLAEGLANRAVAERLGISTRTAQKHVENLFKKFNVHGRNELVELADRAGLLTA